MKIFALDSSEKSASVAIMDGNEIIAEYYNLTGFTHSCTLMPMVSSIFKNTKTDIKDIDVFSVCVGPGSFTGIRIGISSVKAMALVLGKPCVGVSSLEALAVGFPANDGIICAVIDAGNDNVYNAIFKSYDTKYERLCEDRFVNINDLSIELKSYCADNIYLVGNGCKIFYSMFGNNISNLAIVSDIYNYVRAGSILRIAKEHYENNLYTTVKEISPTYLRKSQAEMVLANKLIYNKNNSN